MKESRESLELDKILSAAAAYAVLEGGKERLARFTPTSDIGEARRLLDLTEEADLLLLTLGAGRVLYYPPQGDALERAEKGATLSCTELLSAAALLRSARACYSSVRSFADERIVRLKELTEYLIFDRALEEDITEKIIGENELHDRASEKLFAIRREIRLLNERIRARLQEYLAGGERKYLQDELITMRGERYVLPVKVEYKRAVRGLIHDRSQSGQTVFIEPEEVLEMNNELRTLHLDEEQEIARILAELSHRVGAHREALERDTDILSEVDSFYARAEYGHRLKCVRPVLNGKGAVHIVKGRHPLLDPKRAVPVSVSVGEDYRFLLISGANTGGKTVTLKMCGLFCLMAACGLFVPAAEGTSLPVFDQVFCDVGDSQSIEENLSTFSSHVVSLKYILEHAGEKSFVLIDEPGGGTDPEEGQALARAVLKTLLKRGTRGIVTTHYSALKEYAFSAEGAENGCMEFDSESLKPLFRLKIGMPGASNALFICSKLGLPEEVILEARSHLSLGAQAFDHTVRAAEESRIKADAAREEAEAIRREWQEKLTSLEKEEAAFKKEREKFLLTSRAEARRVILSRTAEAEELVAEIEEIFKKEQLSEADLIRARTLRNKMESALPAEEEEKVRLEPADPKTLKAGDKVFLQSLNAEGTVLSVNQSKGEAQVQSGFMQVRCKIKELFWARKKEEKKERVEVIRNLQERPVVPREVNLIGLSASEALQELDDFLDSAVLNNFDEVRIVHGMGTGKLRAAVQNALRKDKRIKEFRLGKYGEGESGVTIAKLN